MPFQKGNKLSKGRQKGVSNKVNLKVKQAIQELLEGHWHYIEEDIKELEPKDRLNFLLNLASYVIPKLRSVEVGVDVNVEHNALGLSTEDFIELEAEITDMNDRGDGQENN